MENKITPKLIEKAKQARSPEELLSLAKENGLDISEKEAETLFEQLGKTGELSDDELDGVSGGGCYSGDELVVTELYHCNQWTCKFCGQVAGDRHEKHTCAGTGNRNSTVCSECKYGKGWLVRVCKNPAKRKK